ncbi:PTS sugar transporter subunit IIA [Streptococcus tangpeifui]|uniref:PTS sugar transporter subunit IIA n=1 Tax=Streptococcus tangpeifui TaxID=2709400 RepID=UPI0013EA2073|nr:MULTISPECIES: PTS sugar transporter subunit IIA [unclassified Streptococcus]
MSENIKLLDYLDERLIFTGQSFKASTDLFETISNVALKLGNVREDFLPRVMDREANFPTGIQLENIGVAIPHTDAECILNEFVAVVVNQSPTIFKSMEDPSQSVPASIVFVLGLNQPHKQLEMLQSLMGLLQNEKLLFQIVAATSAEEILKIVKTNNL